jgi:hypothetical protein
MLPVKAERSFAVRKVFPTFRFAEPLPTVLDIGQHLDRRRGLFKIAGRQAPAGAELHVQVHLDVEDGREAGRRFAHVSELGRLVDGERVGARNSVRNR